MAGAEAGGLTAADRERGVTLAAEGGLHSGHLPSHVPALGSAGYPPSGSAGYPPSGSGARGAWSGGKAVQ